MVLPQWLESIQIWMERNHLQISCTKTKWLWQFRPSRSETISSLTLSGLALVILSFSWAHSSYLKSRCQLLPGKHNTICCVPCALSYIKGPSDSHSCPRLSHSSTTATLYTLSCSWKPYGNTPTILECAPCMVACMSLLHKLHWLPVCFQEWLKVLVVTCKSIKGIRTGYPKELLSLITFA